MGGHEISRIGPGLLILLGIGRGDGEEKLRYLTEKVTNLRDRFIELLRAQNIPTRAGKFGEHMLVEIQNDGPVTIWLER